MKKSILILASMFSIVFLSLTSVAGAEPPPSSPENAPGLMDAGSVFDSHPQKLHEEAFVTSEQEEAGGSVRREAPGFLDDELSPVKGETLDQGEPEKKMEDMESDSEKLKM